MRTPKVRALVCALALVLASGAVVPHPALAWDTYAKDYWDTAPSQDDSPLDAVLLDVGPDPGMWGYRAQHTFDVADLTLADSDWVRFLVTEQDIVDDMSFLIDAHTEDWRVDPVIEVYGPYGGFAYMDPWGVWGIDGLAIAGNDDWTASPFGSASLTFRPKALKLPWGWYYARIRPDWYGAGTGFDSRAGRYQLRVKRGSFLRIAGINRAQTADLIGHEMAWSGMQRTVVVANGWNFPDALAASALCKAKDAPLLLVGTDSVPAQTKYAMQEYKADDVWIVGGEAAVSTKVQAELAATIKQYTATAPTFTRVAGEDRCGTAADVVANVAILGGQMSGLAFVVNGYRFPDALAASPVAANRFDAKYTPVLLTHPGSLDEVTRNTIGNWGITDVVILGGEDAVSTNVEAQLAQLLGGSHVLRLAGSTRYETAKKVAAWAVNVTGPGPTTGHRIGTYANPAIAEALPYKHMIGVASGDNFPDALAAGAMCGRAGMPLLLTGKWFLSPWIYAYPNQVGGVESYASLVGGYAFDRSMVFGAEPTISFDVGRWLDQTSTYFYGGSTLSR
jgi:putative cell wall-binding protein